MFFLFLELLPVCKAQDKTLIEFVLSVTASRLEYNSVQTGQMVAPLTVAANMSTRQLGFYQHQQCALPTTSGFYQTNK